LSKRDWFKFGYLALAWGSHYMWVKIGLREMQVLTMISLRVLIATIAMLIYNRLRHSKNPPNSFWPAFFFLGIFNLALPFVLITWSEKYISSGMTSILNSTTPLFTVLLAWIFLRDEPLTLQKLAGIVISFIGVFILVSDKIQAQTNNYWLGVIFVLVSSLCYGVSAVYARIKVQGLNYSVQSLGQVAAATTLVLPAAIFVEAPFTLPRLPMSWIVVLVMGLVLTFTGVMTFYSLLNSVGATRTMMVSYTYPLVGVLLGIIFLGEVPTLNLVGGGLLIILGIIIVNTRFRKNGAI
jgi:drug/metabolite transporter (DMT)-like permease